MTDDSTPQFDPRFSPEFQPGYSDGDNAPAFAAPAPTAPGPHPQSQPAPARPPVGLAPQVTAYPAAPVESTRSAARRNAPAAPGVVSAPVVTGASATGGWPSDSSAVVSTDQSDAFATEESAPSLGAQVRNPFLLVLGVIAAALVIVGSWMFAQAYSAFSDTGNFASPADFVALESAMRVAPIVILAGVGVAVGVLFIFARTWRPRR